MAKYYDKINNRLVFVGESSNSNFWDKHWDKYSIDKMYPKYISPVDYVIVNSKKYLDSGAKIIEGGCGVGQQVFKMQNAGFNAIGVDYAKKTIDFVNKMKPEIDIRLGDVTKLDFEDEFFDAYWSFGVIEHFYSGYNQTINEMFRVLKSGAYLFITFPHLSKLRKIKARKKLYPEWIEKPENIKKFYQFALDEKKVIEDLKKIGFILVKKKKMGGLKGFKDETNFLNGFFQKIYSSKSLISRIISRLLSDILANYSSHMMFLILKKN